MKKIVLPAVLLIAVACHTSKNAGTTGPQASASPGQTLYEAQCGNCHNLKAPSSRTVAEWDEIVPPMVKKANKKAGSVVIDEAGQTAILEYLHANAMK